MRSLRGLLPLAFVSYAVVIATRSLWIAPFFGEVHGFDIAERGNAALVMAVAMSAGRWPTVRSSGRSGARSARRSSGAP